MGGVKSNSKPRVVFSLQYFDGKSMPQTIMETYEADAGMDTEKAFNFTIAKIKEEKFSKKVEKHRHD